MKSSLVRVLLTLLLGVLLAGAAGAAPLVVQGDSEEAKGPARPAVPPSLLPVSVRFDGSEGEPTPGRDLSTTVEVVLFLSLLTLLPGLLLTMTCFTRIVIVLSFVRRAMSTPELPPNPIVIGLALFLTVAVMQPVASDVYDSALKPYLDGELGFEAAGDRASTRLKTFMLDYTRESDIALFLEVGGDGAVDEIQQLPLRVVVPAFVLSELKTSFTMGFVIYLPFLVVDLVIASILLSMGMFMLPPMLIATPLKILLFVLVDGWHLVIGELWTGLRLS